MTTVREPKTVVLQAGKFAAALVLLMQIASCAALSDPGPTQSAQGGGSRTEVIGRAGKVELLVRELLAANETEYPFYRYYLYLMISDRTAPNAAQRRAAAHAYMCQFPSDHEAVSIDIARERLAVFYAPVRASDKDAAKEISTGDELLEAYSYAYARMLKERIGQRLGDELLEADIGVLAAPRPIGSRGEGVARGVQFMDLSDVSVDEVSVAMKRLRVAIEGEYTVRQVTVTTRVDPETGEAIETRTEEIPVVIDLPTERWSSEIRDFFAAVGQMFVPEAQAGIPPCT